MALLEETEFRFGVTAVFFCFAASYACITCNFTRVVFADFPVTAADITAPNVCAAIQDTGACLTERFPLFAALQVASIIIRA